MLQKYYGVQCITLDWDRCISILIELTPGYAEFDTTDSTLTTMTTMTLSNKKMVPIFTPTNSYDDGDITLKFDDNVEFRVHALILRQASSFSKDMLQMPQPIDSKNISAIVMPGGSASEIDFILSFIYSVTRTIPMLDSLDRIADILDAAEK